MGRKRTQEDPQMLEIQRQMEALKQKQEQAMAAVLKAQQELLQKEQETNTAKRDLHEAEAKKEKAAAEADFSVKIATGDEVASQLANALQRESRVCLCAFTLLLQPVGKSLFLMHNGASSNVSRNAQVARAGDGYAYVDTFLGEPVASYIRDEVGHCLSRRCCAKERVVCPNNARGCVLPSSPARRHATTPVLT
jgi:hypothetical protein